MVAKRVELLVSLLLAGQFVAGSAHALPAVGAETHKAKPKIDLAFCIDTTGSMSGEINNVKAKTKEIVAKLAGGKPAPEIRVGLVAYRDRGDDYVTKVFPFNSDIDRVVSDISSLQAAGGGDTPESVNEALHVSVNNLKWSDDSKTLKLLFLIGDAGPHIYSNDYDWHKEAKEAISRGIQINTVGCQGLEAAGGETVFREIAKLSDGGYEPLAYRTEVADVHGKKETVISSGGAVYKVSAKSADAWKDGASALRARGEAVAVSSPVSAPAYSARAKGAGFACMTTAPSRAAMAAEMSAGVPGSIGREDNNLADVVLQATKRAAAKKLRVEFK